jgi:trehalose 6-phosphate phosphatase
MPEAGISPDLTLWMFDFDGTLSPLVADRTAASLDPNCRDMLHQLAAKRNYRCAVISSRLLADITSCVDVPGIYLGGGSGLEWRLPDGRLRVPKADRMDAIQKIRETLIPEIMEWSRLPGIEIEDKQWSVAIHIRRAPYSEKRLKWTLQRNIFARHEHRHPPNPSRTTSATRGQRRGSACPSSRSVQNP